MAMTSDLPSRPAVGMSDSFRRSLGIPALVLFGFAYMLPLTMFTTYGIVTEITQGHLPAAYMITLVVMTLTAYSYTRMVKARPLAGSAYSYTREAFGPRTGFIVGWALMLDYMLLPLLVYLVIGLYMNAYFPAVPMWLWIVGSALIITGLNIIGIVLVTRVNLVLILAQVVFLVVFLAMAVLTLGGGLQGNLLAPVYGPDMQFASLAHGAAILCLSFLGFDAISTLSEEARDATSSVPKAIMTVTVGGGVLFVVIAYVGHLVYPDWHSFTDADTAALDVIRSVGGAFLVSFFTATYVAGCFASGLASQASVARILFAMGREGVLPRQWFGHLHKKFNTPVFPICLVGVVGLAALILDLDLVASMISFGALSAFTFVNLSVIKFYAVDRQQRQGMQLIQYGVIPALGALASLWLWTSLSATAFMVGTAWILIGAIHMFTQKRIALHEL